MVKRPSQKKPISEKSEAIPFDEALRRLVNTPPKPKQKKDGGFVKKPPRSTERR